MAVNPSNLPVVFNFGNQTIRTIDQNGEIWFVANDVCAALDISNPRQAVSRLDDDERGVISNDTPSGTQDLNIISESGLYSLVMSSRKAEAKHFKRWVTHEVLPKIRKTGRYDAAGAPVMIEAPKEGSIDVRALLLSGQSDPTVPLPPEVAQELERRAWQMAGEAFQLAKEHLQRRVAFSCEHDYPQRRLNVPRAMMVLNEGGLGHALAHAYHQELSRCETFMRIAQDGLTEAMNKLGKHTAKP